MKVRHFLNGLAMLLTVCAQSVAQQNCVQPIMVNDSKFKPGQVWSYKARSGEENSTLTILRTEETPKLGIIVHVRIDGIHLGECGAWPAANLLPHAPFARASLDASVTKLIRTVHEIPAYEDGYQDWLSHCGGIYTIQVSKMIAIDDAQFKAARGCPS